MGSYNHKRRHSPEPWGHWHRVGTAQTMSKEETQESGRHLWPKGKASGLATQLDSHPWHILIPCPPCPIWLSELCSEYLSDLSTALLLCHSYPRPRCCISHLYLSCSLLTGSPPSHPDIPSFLSQTAIPGFLSKCKWITHHMPECSHTNAIACLSL